MSSVREFYDQLADSYHLIFEDWDRSIERQGAALTSILATRWNLSRGDIVDAAVGIGTQALGLVSRGFSVIAADLSVRAVERARREAAARHLHLPVLVADFRSMPLRSASADAVISCDNALPHLLAHDEIRRALMEFLRCLRPGGALVLSMRDYGAPPEPGTVEYRPYGERVWNGRKYFAEQEWHWSGSTYNVVLRLHCLEGDTRTADVALETTYLAVPMDTVLGIMRDVGFADVQRVDGVYYQPLLLGTAPQSANDVRA